MTCISVDDDENSRGHVKAERMCPRTGNGVARGTGVSSGVFDSFIATRLRLWILFDFLFVIHVMSAMR